MSDSLKLKGFIKIFEIDAEGNKTLVDEINNSVTPLGKRLALADSMGTRVKYAAFNTEGVLSVHSSLGSWQQNPSEYAQNTSEEGLCLYLLNLSADQKAALTSSSTLLPIYNSDFSLNGDVITGYATSKVTSSSAKEGVSATTALDCQHNLTNTDVVLQAWRFDAGIATGTYNTLAIGTATHSNAFSGLSVWKTLDFYTPLISGQLLPYGFYLRHGVTINGTQFTSDTQWLLGDPTSPSKARIILDFATNTKVALDPSDPRYDYPLGVGYMSQVITDEYLFYSPTVLNTVRVTLSSGETSTLSLNSATPSLLYYNNYIYKAYGSSNLRAYNPSTLASVSSGNITFSAMNIPNYSSGNVIRCCNYGDYFLVANFTQNVAFICSDLTNVGDSLIEMLPFIVDACVYDINNSRYFLTSYDSGKYPDLRYMGSPTSASTTIQSAYGLRICETAGNMISYAFRSEAYEKTAEKGIIVEYGYTFE